MAKVLIIDDNEQLLRMHQKIIKFKGHEVIISTDGKKGLEKAVNEKPSIILLDIMMPEINGLEVLEKLKENQDTKNIPVIMLSNLSDEQHAQEAVTKGASKYIIKGDSDPNHIAQVIDETLGLKSSENKQ